MVTDKNNNRLIALGEIGGMAGAIDFLTALGWVLINRRISNDFLLITNSYTYFNLDMALARVSQAGTCIATK